VSAKSRLREEAGAIAAQSQSQGKARIRTTANETNSNLTPEQMAARIAELEGRPAKGGSVSFKVSEKGAASVYGLGRFPVTLYLEQWDALHSPTLLSFASLSRPISRE
jgi:hypothetical protein